MSSIDYLVNNCDYKVSAFSLNDGQRSNSIQPVSQNDQEMCYLGDIDYGCTIIYPNGKKH
ncbi:hypothetical protein DDB_G0292534 [Dictyostelium discoideum AX4]|uniref:Putative uncharacterized protein DDB_G0292534 n=1 Tax=Dictyostelium discoideum TaxID=44689 RepID=Y9752_DICDI|nr:hypothetical protein DDB_G0292534 [Dictyostelium discoideum AX4]Q54D79.1 RecName: Full=Putative uncharacterized protein DDB_G0292534 [Dictyostelium discoideum]EAL61246.1 hypothetical protein DDB_G0292534 [Dictyostelium discoideum AX4]|eukprot:XP_629617.1 hypothetical protein DDB_G0292534 [Dictyostelium discoideum AX4]